MAGMSTSSFGAPLPILTDRVRDALDALDPATRLEAVSAAIPVYDALARLRARLLEHRGLAFTTIVGWLREGRFTFLFELCEETLIIVGLTVEPPPPDDPEGALACIVRLFGRTRILAVRVPRKAKAPAAEADSPASADARLIGQHGDRSVTLPAAAGWRPLGIGAMPARRSALVRALADVLIMARAAIALTGPPPAAAVASPTERALSLDGLRFGVTLVEALARARTGLRRARSGLSPSTVRAAERLCRQARAQRLPGEPIGLSLAVLTGLPPVRAGAKVLLSHAARQAPDGCDARATIDTIRRDLETALAHGGIGQIWMTGRGDVPDASLLEVDPGNPRPVALPRLVPSAAPDSEISDETPTPVSGDDGLARIGDEPYVLTVDRAAGRQGQRAFFVDEGADHPENEPPDSRGI